MISILFKSILNIILLKQIYLGIPKDNISIISTWNKVVFVIRHLYASYGIFVMVQTVKLHTL